MGLGLRLRRGRGVWLTVGVRQQQLLHFAQALTRAIHEGALLTATDLLRGEKVRPMVQDLVQNWETVAANAVDGARLVDERGFRFGTHYRSLNVLTLLLSWRLLGRQWLAEHSLGVTAKDSFEKSLDAAFAASYDR